MVPADIFGRARNVLSGGDDGARGSVARVADVVSRMCGRPKGADAGRERTPRVLAAAAGWCEWNFRDHARQATTGATDVQRTNGQSDFFPRPGEELRRTGQAGTGDAVHVSSDGILRAAVPLHATGGYHCWRPDRQPKSCGD